MFANRTLEFAEVVKTVVRRYIGEQQVPLVRLLWREPLENSATDITGGFVRQGVEFRVWGTGAA